MHLKARFDNLTALYEVCHSLERFNSKTCSLLFTRVATTVFVAADAAGAGVMFYANLQNDGLFQAIDITSRQDNDILLEVTVEYLSKALKSILADPTSELLLVRCDNLPVLRFTATSRPGEMPRIVQDVPAQVCNRPEELDVVRRLAMPTPDILISVPLAQVRTLVERLKKVSALVTIEATARGQLSFRVHTDALEFESTFNNLLIEELEATDDQPEPPPRPDAAAVQVDLRELTRCLPSSHVQFSKSVCGIKTDHSLILYFILHGDNNAFYILLPAKG